MLGIYAACGSIFEIFANSRSGTFQKIDTFRDFCRISGGVAIGFSKFWSYGGPSFRRRTSLIYLIGGLLVAATDHFIQFPIKAGR